MTIIGLTGTSGSGKNTVAKVFERFQIAHIDCDELARRVTRRGQPCVQELAERLEITRRSANYFLKAMTQTGILQVVDMHRAAGRGRPEQVYGRAAAENTDRIH